MQEFPNRKSEQERCTIAAPESTGRRIKTNSRVRFVWKITKHPAENAPCVWKVFVAKKRSAGIVFCLAAKTWVIPAI
jgi:hypothetical protein